MAPDSQASPAIWPAMTQSLAAGKARATAGSRVALPQTQHVSCSAWSVPCRCMLLYFRLMQYPMSANRAGQPCLAVCCIAALAPQPRCSTLCATSSPSNSCSQSNCQRACALCDLQGIQLVPVQYQPVVSKPLLLQSTQPHCVVLRFPGSVRLCTGWALWHFTINHLA